MIRAILLALIFISCTNPNNQPQAEPDAAFETDFIDVYKLTIGNTWLYGKYDSFIADMGMPGMVTINNNESVIQTKADLDKIISTAKAPQIVTLHYPGINMWYGYENSIIPATFDFRKTSRRLTYETTTFDNNYTVDQFKKQFPRSAASTATALLPESFFEMETKEKGTDMEHFILKRKSKDDPNTTPIVEFTFNKGKLIFIFFANF
jgi:hypothetical protein